MKILNITEEGRFGGPHKRIAEVAQGLRSKGISTLAVFPEEESLPYQKFLADKQIPFHTMSLHRITKNKKHLFKYFLFFIPEVISIIRLIKKNKIDIVHTNGAIQFKSVIAAKLAGAKSIWHLNDTYMPYFLRFFFNMIAPYFADHFIVACEKSKEYYLSSQKKLRSKTTTTIQAPVDTKLFAPYITKDKKAIPLADFPGIKVIMVGNLNPIKGHETFIRMANAFNLSNDSNKPVNFFIVGRFLKNQEEYISKIQQLVKELNLNNLHFLGARSDVKDLLNEADVYVCSSNFEASPIAVWEALSMERAVISTDVGDVKKIFAEHNCGIVVPTKDYKRMVVELQKILNDTSLKKRYETNARETAIQFFDLKTCVALHQKAYEDLV